MGAQGRASMAALTLLFSPPHPPDFCFLIFSINPTGLGGLLPPNPHPSISLHRRVLGAGGHKGQPGTHLPHHASVCLVFYSPPPPTLYPPPSVHPPHQERRDLDLMGTHPAGTPLTVPGTPGQGGRRDSGGGGGHQDWGNIRRWQGATTPPVHFVSLQGLAPCGGGTG